MLNKNQLKLVRQLEQKKHRQRERLFVAEGPKVVGDLMAHGFHPTLLFATSDFTNRLTADSKAISVTDNELQRLSFLQHPQHVLGVFPIPEQRETPCIGCSELCLALDGVQDPGNLGTIIRIADWFGIDNIFCSNDTADAWNPKVVQATMGSIARVNIHYTDLEKLMTEAKIPVYGTLLDGDDIYRENLTQGGIIVMGNEGNGISPNIRRLITRKLLIPSFSNNTDRAESLNVAIATAITCSEFRRRH